MGKKKSPEKNGELSDVNKESSDPFIEIQEDKSETFMIYDVYDVPTPIATILFALQVVYCLTVFHTTPTFNDAKKEGFGKHCGKRRKCW